MIDPPDNVTPIGPLMDPERQGLKTVARGGGILVEETDLGLVSVVQNGTVSVVNEEGVEVLMDPDEALHVAAVILRAACAAREQGHAISGWRKPRAKRGEGARIQVTCRGETRVVRASKLRKPRVCSECKSPVDELWIDATSRVGASPLGCEICHGCMTDLLGVERGLRALPKPEES